MTPKNTTKLVTRIFLERMYMTYTRNCKITGNYTSMSVAYDFIDTGSPSTIAMIAIMSIVLIQVRALRLWLALRCPSDSDVQSSVPLRESLNGGLDVQTRCKVPL